MNPAPSGPLFLTAYLAPMRFLFKTLLTLFFLVLLNSTAVAYDNKYVHPYIAVQAFLLLPQDLRAAIGGANLGSFTGERSCDQAKSGTSITLGSSDEDVYNPLGDTCLNPMNSGYLFHHHFYDPDISDDSKNGLCNSQGAVFYVETYMNIAIQSFKDHPEKSYWYLGRAAHLLADSTVPAHVHRDSHIAELQDPDSYEPYITYP